MQQQPRKQSPHGAKAITLDRDKIIARYRLLLFIAITLAAALALELHIIFGR
ncbi:MAG TPA: hypothetical protein VGL94_08285 [Ktedonobacteraceae bacterium]|jgi:hypothetical protein